MRRFRSFNHSTCKTVLNPLEAVYLRLRKIVVERVTVVKFRVDNRGSDGTCCFRIKVRTDIFYRSRDSLLVSEDFVWIASEMDQYRTNYLFDFSDSGVHKRATGPNVAFALSHRKDTHRLKEESDCEIGYIGELHFSTNFEYDQFIVLQVSATAVTNESLQTQRSCAVRSPSENDFNRVCN